MANSYHQIYLQTVFPVKYREAVLCEQWRGIVFEIMGNLINETGCRTIIVNGVEDHVHCLFGLKPTIAVSDLLKGVKAKSFKYINDHRLTGNHFKWQEGYGAFSYSHSHIDKVYHYIANQEEHHRKQSFREEYIDMLNKFQVPYDERYLFHEPL